jgi:hypothetical protein
MSNINLLESAQGKKNNSRGILSGKSFVIPVIILVFVFLIFGATKIYASYLDKKKASIDEENTQELANLSGKNVERIFDFTERLKLAKEKTLLKKNYNNYLKELEDGLVQGITVSSLKYSDSGVEVSMVADNFKVVAQQVLSFKKTNNYFKDLSISKTSRNEEGKIEFSLSRK